MKTRAVGMITILAAALAAPMAVAQAPAAGKQEVVAKLEKISAALQLTPRQKAQLLPIIKEEAPQLEAVKKDGSLGGIQKAMRLKQISTDIDAKVMPILNPVQQQKWQVMREMERKEMLQKLEGAK